MFILLRIKKQRNVRKCFFRSWNFLSVVDDHWVLKSECWKQKEKKKNENVFLYKVKDSKMLWSFKLLDWDKNQQPFTADLNMRVGKIKEKIEIILSLIFLFWFQTLQFGTLLPQGTFARKEILSCYLEGTLSLKYCSRFHLNKVS